LGRLIHKFSNNGEKFLWRHVARESNRVTNVFIEFGLSIENNGRIFFVIPRFISDLVSVDAVSFNFPFD